MVIQRIQSVYLLIAVILMAVFAFFPALSFELGGRNFVYGALEAGKVGVTHVDPLMLMLIILIVFLAITSSSGCLCWLPLPFRLLSSAIGMVFQ